MLSLNKYKLFFFDFDGVIVDSVPSKGRAFQEVYKLADANVKRYILDYHLRHGGVSRRAKFEYFENGLLKDYPEKRSIEELCNAFEREYEVLFKNIEFISGAVRLISGLDLDSVYIVTGTPHPEILRQIPSLSLPIKLENVFGFPNVKEEIIAKICDEREISRTDAILFGDAMTDFNAANRSGVTFCGINPCEEVSKLSPLWFNDFENVS